MLLNLTLCAFKTCNTVSKQPQEVVAACSFPERLVLLKEIEINSEFKKKKKINNTDKVEYKQLKLFTEGFYNLAQF